ncbi:MAG: WXG100 family type VII secretion target [Eubacterium sp.]|nr:WXG100 family type VII secretion target [Eubacterium sp.]
MADCVYKFQEMKNAAASIRSIAENYKNAANTLESDFISATNEWQGASKDAMKNFISGPVMEYTRDTVPQLLNAFADMLDADAEQMSSADTQVAENIPTSLGG